MPPLHEELDAMLLGRDRIRIVLWHTLDNLNLLDIQLKPALRPLIRADLAGDDDTRFLRKPLQGLEYFRRDTGLMGNSLDRSGPVAKDREEQFAAFAHVVKPAAQGDGLALVRADFANCGNGRGDGCGRSCVDFGHDQNRFREPS